MKRLAVLTMAAVALTATAAFSQVATVSPAPTGWMETISPILTDLLKAVVSAVGVAIVLFIKARWGIDLSAFRQSSFQLAATNAAGILKNTGDMSRAVDYLKEAAPEAIEHFGIPEGKLSEKIEAKAGIIEAAGGVIPVMPGVVEGSIVRR